MHTLGLVYNNVNHYTIVSSIDLRMAIMMYSLHDNVYMHEHARFECMLQDKNKIKIKKINRLEELFIIMDSITTDKTSTVDLMMHRALIM